MRRDGGAAGTTAIDGCAMASAKSGIVFGAAFAFDGGAGSIIALNKSPNTCPCSPAVGTSAHIVRHGGSALAPEGIAAMHPPEHLVATSPQHHGAARMPCALLCQSHF